jgi:O-antigen/teichoic acid export membrane protein
MDQQKLALLLKLVGIILALTLLRNALSSVLMGLHRYDIYNAIQVSYAIALALVQGAVVIKGGQVIAVMLGTIAVMVAGLISFILAIHHLIPKVRLFRLPDGYFLRLLFSFGMYMMLINLGAAILFNVDKVIIGWLLGPESVTYYAVPTQIALKIHNGLAVFVSFLFPLASETKSIGDTATLRKIYLQSMRYIVLIDGLVMVLVGTFAREILDIWIDPDFGAVSAPILLLTSSGYLLFALSIPTYHILLGMGHPRELAMLNMLATLCVIASLTAGLIFFNLIGGSFGAMIGMGTIFVLPWYAQRLLSIPWKTAFRDSYGRTLMCSISGMLISAVLPPHFLIRLLYYGGFILVLLRYGNTRREDWRMVQGGWQQMMARVLVLVRSR